MSRKLGLWAVVAASRVNPVRFDWRRHFASRWASDATSIEDRNALSPGQLRHCGVSRGLLRAALFGYFSAIDADPRGARITLLEVLGVSTAVDEAGLTIVVSAENFYIKQYPGRLTLM